MAVTIISLSNHVDVGLLREHRRIRHLGAQSHGSLGSLMGYGGKALGVLSLRVTCALDSRELIRRAEQMRERRGGRASVSPVP